MSVNEQIEEFLAQQRFAVVGASVHREKYGNKVLRCYLQAGRDVAAIHPREREIEGVPVFGRLADLPQAPDAVSVITPPPITENVVEEAAALGIRHVWMQPGAESALAVRRAEEFGMNVIAGGPCLLVALGFREDG